MSDDATLKSGLRRVLTALARERTTITYRDLAELAAVPPPHRIHRLTLLLESLVVEDHAADRPLLAALAISRATGDIPQRGFFDLLRQLGRYDGPDRGREAWLAHRDELELAWAYWGSRNRIS